MSLIGSLTRRGRQLPIGKIKEYQLISQRSRLLNADDRWSILVSLDIVEEADDEDGEPTFRIKEHLVEVANDAPKAKNWGHYYEITPDGELMVVRTSRR